MVDAYETTDGYSVRLVDGVWTAEGSRVFDPAKPYENRDPRLRMTICVNEETGWPTWNETPIYTYQGGANGQPLNGGTPTGYYLKKYCQGDIDLRSNSTNKSAYHTWITYRLGEFYLNYAEAEFQLGHEDVAREYVNKVRARKSVNMPSITDSGEALLKRIYHERQIELAFEGHRFFDLRRWKIADNTPIVGLNIIKDGEGKFSYERYVLSLDSRKNEWKDAFFVLPIHYSEIQKSNESLEQNNGY